MSAGSDIFLAKKREINVITAPIKNETCDLVRTWKYNLIFCSGERILGPKILWSAQMRPPKQCEICVSRLRGDCYEDMLLKIFSTVGEIYEIRILVDPNGIGRGFAFITFYKPEKAAEAIKRYHGYKISSYRISVTESLGNKLHLCGIPLHVNEEQVKIKLKTSFTGVRSVSVPRNVTNPGSNCGYAIVSFKNHKDAFDVKMSLSSNEVYLWDGTVLPEWAIPEPPKLPTFSDQEQVPRLQTKCPYKTKSITYSSNKLFLWSPYSSNNMSAYQFRLKRI